jgi:hypothetical protein
MTSSRLRCPEGPVPVEAITSSRLAVLFPVGQRVRGRLLARLDEEQYLLRLKGYTLVAESSIELEEGAPISATVVSTWPRLHLQIRQAPDERQADRRKKQSGLKDSGDEAPQHGGRAVIDIRV